MPFKKVGELDEEEVERVLERIRRYARHIKEVPAAVLAVLLVAKYRNAEPLYYTEIAEIVGAILDRNPLDLLPYIRAIACELSDAGYLIRERRGRRTMVRLKDDAILPEVEARIRHGCRTVLEDFIEELLTHLA